MTARIKILPQDLANKIAAGEVVERPASVVKELVENAIDAHATEVTIILQKGGTELIRIVDNGAGMAPEDLRMAFERHATSKIHSIADLEAIRSLGFRGEALASIASVARVEARTVPRDNELGSELHLEGGRVVSEKPAAGTPGTAISVKTLFFNTPARRKFLKADSTEYRHCLAIATRFALCYPDIHFTFVHNGVVIWEVRPQTLEERIWAIMGDRLKNRLVQIEDDSGAVRLSGFVGNHETVRQTSGEQYLFLNGRYITDKSLNHAVISGYGDILAHGGYPFYCIHLTIDPARVDVNVHPTKMQVKFADDRLIYALVRGAVKRGLRSADVIPAFSDQENLVPPSGWAHFGKPPSMQSGAEQEGGSFDPQQYMPSNLVKPDLGQMQLDMHRQPADDRWLSEKPEAEGSAVAPGSFAFGQQHVWQFHNKYIISQTDTGIVIIDQHAAHERILYERALSRFKTNQPASQKLLFPVLIELSVEDAEILKEILPYLEKIGFLIKDFGARTAVIEGVPGGLKIKRYESVLRHILDDVKRGKREKLEIRDNVAKTFACHTAIRTGDPLSLPEMIALIEQLFAAETPYFCPHGRPVMTKITLEDLDKRFGRL